MRKYVDQKLNIVKVRAIDVSSEDYFNENGFFVRAETAGNIVYVPFMHFHSSTVSYSIASNVATIVLADALPSDVEVGDSVYISGMTNTALNGTFVLTDVSDSTIEFDVTTDDDEGEDTGGLVFHYPITKNFDASYIFNDPELVKLIISTNTTADDIYVGYAR